MDGKDLLSSNARVLESASDYHRVFIHHLSVLVAHARAGSHAQRIANSDFEMASSTGFADGHHNISRKILLVNAHTTKEAGLSARTKLNQDLGGIVDFDVAFARC